MLAQTWAQRAVRMSLVQQVTTTYIELRALDRQLEIAQQATKVRQDSVGLTRTLEQGGDAPLSDVRQAEQLLYTATSQIPQIEQQIQQDENAMRLLLAQDPGRWRIQIPMRWRRLLQICPQVCHHSFSSAGRIFSRPKLNSWQLTRRSALHAHSSFPSSRLAHRRYGRQHDCKPVRHLGRNSLWTWYLNSTAL